MNAIATVSRAFLVTLLYVPSCIVGSGLSRRAEGFGADAGSVVGDSAAAGEAGEFETPRAGALRIGFFGPGGVAAADTDEALFCFLEHGPELAAEDTIGAADNLLRHS